MVRGNLAVAAFVLVFALGAVCAAQGGEVFIFVRPHQAYVFVDGKPFGDGNLSVRLPVGKHTIAAYNYGYIPQSQDVEVRKGQTPRIDFKLERIPARVTGPWGRIQIEGAPRAAVFLNGKTPGYFVGHGDEFDSSFFAWQQLVVPPGTHQVTVVDKHKEVWSGPVTVNANERVIVDVAHGGTQRAKRWSYGSSVKDLPRFWTTALGDDSVTVAPVTGALNAEQKSLKCGESSKLAWSSTETVDAQIDNGSSSTQNLPTTGDLAVRPLKTTVYTLKATGPGGTVTSSTNVDVDPTVQANVTASPTDVRYRKIGDRVIQQTPSTVSWNTSNSHSRTLNSNPLGMPAGTQEVQPVPAQTSEGPVNETVNYTLVATNECGGSETRTATVHVTGSIEPIPKVPLASVFFPTGYPSEKYPEIGLVHSERIALSDAAAGFNKYLEYDPDTRLQIVGHADTRDANAPNQALGERRVAVVKQYLISIGIRAERLETVAYGEEQPLDESTVKSLEQENPNPSQSKDIRATVLAYQRRVDLVMIPKGAEGVVSLRFYPNNAPELSILRNLNRQDHHAVEDAQGAGGVQTTATSGATR